MSDWFHYYSHEFSIRRYLCSVFTLVNTTWVANYSSFRFFIICDHFVIYFVLVLAVGETIGTRILCVFFSILFFGLDTGCGAFNQYFCTTYGWVDGCWLLLYVDLVHLFPPWTHAMCGHTDGIRAAVAAVAEQIEFQFQLRYGRRSVVVIGTDDRSNEFCAIFVRNAIFYHSYHSFKRPMLASRTKKWHPWIIYNFSCE